jgi:hypothetical protein
MESQLQATRFLAFSFAAAALSVTSANAMAAGSSASDISASFTTDGINTVLDPVNRLVGGPGNSYSTSNGIGAYHTTLVLGTGVSAPELTVDAAKGRSHVERIFGVDTASTSGEGSLSGLNVKIAPYVPPGSDVLPFPYLQITAKEAEETANYNFIAIVPSRTSAFSTGKITMLKITGSLIGGKTLTFRDVPKENTVLYQSDSLTITLNQKIVTALISCMPKCQFTPYGIGASAIDVTFNNAKLGNSTVSGDISIASGAAGQGTVQ